MTNKLKGDLIWAGCLVAWIIMLVIPHSRDAFIKLTSEHSYAGAFVKFFILASMGDLLGKRILTGNWHIEKGFLLKGFVWGILGMAISLVFTVFTGGVKVAQEVGKLPFVGNKLALSFYGSAIMNLTFGPMMYVYHKFGDLCVDHYVENKNFAFDIDEMISKIEWSVMVKFSWLTTCLWVWIPCHTIVFLLPKAYQVLVSAFLSIMLGVLIALSKRSQTGRVGTQSAV